MAWVEETQTDYYRSEDWNTHRIRVCPEFGNCVEATIPSDIPLDPDKYCCMPWLEYPFFAGERYQVSWDAREDTQETQLNIDFELED